MDIIKRNFFRILLSGALGENEALEPMTRFKWNRLVQMIKAQDVVAIAIDGLSQHSHDEGYNMPSDILDDLASSDGNIEDKRFDFSHHIEVPELSNTLLDNRLKKIFDEERQEISRIVGLGALKYFILKVDARKNMLFNPEESDLETYFPDTYVPGSSERMLLYRELDHLQSEEEVAEFTMMVLALEISIPFSTMVVERSRS